MRGKPQKYPQVSLHSIGLLHRDLALRNILASSDFQTAYLCDLEGAYGSEESPEIADAAHLDRTAKPFSVASDVYMFGRLMADLILGNNTWTCWQGTFGGTQLPPAPFRDIVLLCVAFEPSERPSMHQVRAMLEAVPIGAST